MLCLHTAGAPALGQVGLPSLDTFHSEIKYVLSAHRHRETPIKLEFRILRLENIQVKINIKRELVQIASTLQRLVDVSKHLHI